MPIAHRRHSLTTTKGEPLFLISMPNPSKRPCVLHGVRFWQGEGRTRYESKARIFDEEFGYTVTLPKGHPGWTNVKPVPVATATADWGPEESDVDASLEEGDDEDE